MLCSFFIPKDADLLRNRKVNTKKRLNRHLPELAFLILGTYFTAPFRYKSDRRAQDVRGTSVLRRPFHGFRWMPVLKRPKRSVDVERRQEPAVSTLARSRVTNYATIAFVMFVSSLVSSTCYIIHDSGASVNSNFKFF